MHRNVHGRLFADVFVPLTGFIAKKESKTAVNKWFYIYIFLLFLWGQSRLGVWSRLEGLGWCLGPGGLSSSTIWRSHREHVTRWEVRPKVSLFSHMTHYSNEQLCILNVPTFRAEYPWHENYGFVMWLTRHSLCEQSFRLTFILLRLCKSLSVNVNKC